MFSKQMYHYTYKITIFHSIETEHRKYYYGSRSCKCLPENDISYRSSCKSLKEFIEKNKDVHYTKEILAYFSDRQSAIEHEISLHNEYDVARNPEFFNLAKQSHTGFCTFGLPAPNKGMSHSEETKIKMRKSHSGKSKTEEHKKKLSLSKKGKPNGRLGKKHSDESKAKASQTKKGIPSIKIVCRICDRKELDAGNWSKYIKQFTTPTTWNSPITLRA